jgi:hypothetical protein
MLRHAMYGKDIAKELVPITYYYLRLRDKPNSFNPKLGIDLIRGCIISPDFFLYMYNRIGKKYDWFYANEWTKEQLDEYVTSHRFVIFMMDGEPVGMCAYMVESSLSVNIAYFGLVDGYVGQSLGHKFLQDCISFIWMQYDPESIWLYTTSKDHPNALRTYKKAGFMIEKVDHRHEYFPLKA